MVPQTCLTPLGNEGSSPGAAGPASYWAGGGIFTGPFVR